MSRFVIYRHQGKLGSDTLETGHFVFFKEDDIKLGRINPRMNPLLSKDPEGTIDADNEKDAEKRFRDRRANMFQ